MAEELDLLELVRDKGQKKKRGGENDRQQHG
jgi:hypothetical protein